MSNSFSTVFSKGLYYRHVKNRERVNMNHPNSYNTPTFSWVYWNQPVCPSLCPSVYKKLLCQNAGDGIESHSVVALVQLVTKRQVLGLDQIQSICRWQMLLKLWILFLMGRKYCGKKRKCWLLADCRKTTTLQQYLFLLLIVIPLQNKCFQDILESACLSVYLCVCLYKILVSVIALLGY